MENNTASAKTAAIGLANREKYWNEISSDEKIERTRTQTRNAKRRINDLENTVYKLTELLVHHIHLDGKVMQEVNRYGLDGSGGRLQGAESGIIGNPDEVYF